MEQASLPLGGSKGDEAAAARVPITVLAGFLGSGKTTLLNRILEGGHELKVAVVVNDFGSIDVDSRLVTRRDANVIALDNGCICCTIGADLVSQLTALVEGASCPDHVLVECSGVSDPGRLLVALRDPHLRRLSRVDGVITLVDSAAVDEIPAPMLELARRQLASADLIVFNKADLVSQEKLADLRRRYTYPGARVVSAKHARVPLEAVLGLAPGHLDRGVDGGGSHEHGAELQTWTWESRRPVRYERVRYVLGSLPESVFRAKGFLELVEAPGQRVVVHVVAGRVTMQRLGPWNGDPARSELVFISLDRDLDPSLVNAQLADTVAPAG